MIKLNVGGTHFDLSPRVALRFTFIRGVVCPDASPTVYRVADAIGDDSNADEIGDEALAELLLTIPDDRLFIDRCPRVFADILGFARHGLIARLPLKPRRVFVLAAEFDWWGYPWTASGVRDEVIVVSESQTVESVHHDYIYCDLPRMRLDQLVVDRRNVVMEPPKSVFVEIDGVMREILYEHAVLFRSLRAVLLPDAPQCDVEIGKSRPLYKGVSKHELMSMRPRYKAILKLATIRFKWWSVYRGAIASGCSKILIVEELTRENVDRYVRSFQEVGYPWSFSSKPGMCLYISKDGKHSTRVAVDIGDLRADQQVFFG